MPVLTRDQFRRKLFDVNKYAKIGGLAKGSSQSSMVGLDNAVDAYSTTATSANLFRIFNKIGRPPRVKRVKYKATIEALQLSLTTVQVTANRFTLNTNRVPGVGVGAYNKKPSYQTEAILAFKARSRLSNFVRMVSLLTGEVNNPLIGNDAQRTILKRKLRGESPRRDRNQFTESEVINLW
jgi:hypothetical protein